MRSRRGRRATNDLILADPRVSGVHLEIHRIGDHERKNLRGELAAALDALEKRARRRRDAAF